jgi:hypothetical protein
MRSPTSSPPDLWTTIAAEAAAESPLWADALRPEAERELEAVFSPLAEPRLAAGIETIYEGYLVHYGRPRLFAPADRDTSLLLGDYLYAHGLVRIAALGDVNAVRELAELIAECAHLRAEGSEGDGEAWARATERLADATAEPADVERALTAHARRVG